MAMETQKRILGQVFQQDGCALSWNPEGWSLHVHSTVPALLILAGNHQFSRVGRQCPTANTLHQLGEPGPSSGQGVSPAPQIQVGKNPSDGSYLISVQQPRRRIHLLGGIWRPHHPFPAADGCSVSPVAAPQL